MRSSVPPEKEPFLPMTRQNNDGDSAFELGTSIHGPFLDRAVPATANPLASGSQRRLAEFKSEMRHHPDRGTGYYEYSRTRYTRPSLVESGRHAGRSRVKITGLGYNILGYHVWKRDFFHSCINLSLPVAVAIVFAAYILSFFFWGLAWFALYTYERQCLAGFKKVQQHAFVSALLFSTETQQTIGFGQRAPNDCWISLWMVVAQTIWGQLLDATIMGVIFARISYPKQRARTIFISDSAVIARRDGQLKFMVRLGDVRRSSVVAPSIAATLYLWGQGHATAEGEDIPVRMDAIEFNYPSRVEMLLPVVVEHIVDERSPLFGHTHDSLTSLGAEIVVTFEGTSEGGDQFMARQSYLPNEIHWGFVFAPIIRRAGDSLMHHSIDISRFHEVEPQEDLVMGPPGRLSSKVVVPVKGSIPWPNLTDNTLVLSDHVVLSPVDGKLQLQFRVGDTYPHNMLEVHVRAYLYRWKPRQTPEGEMLPYEVRELNLGYQEGRDRLLLRLPVIVRHVVDNDSPVSRWRQGAVGLAEDANSEIIVVVEGVQYSSSRSMMKQKLYQVFSDVKWAHRFAPCVTQSKNNADGRPLVTWKSFHSIYPVEGALQAKHPSEGQKKGLKPSHSSSSLRTIASGPVSARNMQSRLGIQASPRSEADSSGTTSPSAASSQRPSMAFGSMIYTGQPNSTTDAASLSDLATSVKSPSRPASTLDDEETLSNSTLTERNSLDWKQKRSLFNINFDPDEHKDDTTKLLESRPLTERTRSRQKL